MSTTLAPVRAGVPSRHQVVVALGAVAIDLLMGIAHLANVNGLPGLGRPLALFDLGGEHNLPTWWSSVKLFVIGTLFAMLLPRLSSVPRAFLVVGFTALVFVGLSLDEFAAIHEYFGRRTRSDELPVSGLWPFLFGGLGLLTVAALAVAGRGLWGQDSIAAACVAGGLAALVVAAAGLDLIVNVAPANSVAVQVTSFIEEMAEMLAASVVLFGAWSLTRPVATGVPPVAKSRNGKKLRGRSSRLTMR